MAQPSINRSILEAALVGLEAQRDRIDEQIAKVRGMMEGGQLSRKPAETAAPGKRRREMSPAAKKRIAEAQKRRWAAFRKGQRTG